LRTAFPVNTRYWRYAGFSTGYTFGQAYPNASPRANRVIISTVSLTWPLLELSVELTGTLQMTGFGLPDGTRDLPI